MVLWSAGAATTFSAVGSTPVGPATTRMRVVAVEPGSVAEVMTVLERSGATIVAHLGPRRWLVADGVDIVADAPGVHSVETWRPADGVAPELRLLASQAASSGLGVVWVIVAVAPGADPATVLDRLEAVGGVPRWIEQATGGAQIGLRVPAGRLAGLVDELEETPELVWAEPQAPVRLLNAASVWRCQSGQPGATPIFDRGIHGEGQIIGIMDTGIDIDECRFSDPEFGLPALNQADGTEISPGHRKVLAVDFHWEEDWPPGLFAWDDQGHGTHVAGSAAGDELGNGAHDRVDGMAPAARLVIQDGGARIDDCADLPGLGCPVKPLGPVLEQARTQGARLHTNSWGDEENFLPFGRYTERTADVDRFMWNHKDTLVFFAAGNAGPGDGTVGSPSTGKNVVSVGAALHGDFEPPCVAGFSSRGWTDDGRVKPDLLAPGFSVVSAASNLSVPNPSCFDRTSSGTSMASPTAAGLGALVRQYFSDGYYPGGGARPDDGFEPTAALVKAVLIASAVDVSAMGCPHEPIPSRDQGWGLIKLDTALSFTGDGHGLLVDDHRAGFSTSDDPPVRFDVAVAEPGPLKVVLVWTDAPSSSLADRHLLNDLDLTVTGPNATFLGNSFADGVSVTGGEPDRLNNVEVVLVPAAEQGIWRIEIAPHEIPVPAQDFAVVVTGPVRSGAAPRQIGGRVTP
jgi:subtilisin family serine protease